MIGYILHNGFWHPADHPVVLASNRAFRYGDALFETIRVVNGNICFLEDHLERLHAGMRLLKMEMPPALEAENLRPALDGFIRKNELFQGAKLRLSVYREGKGTYTPETNAVSYLVEAATLPTTEYVLNREGLKIGVFEEQKKTINAFSGLKSANALTYVLAGIYKQEQGWDDALIINDLANLAESVSSNLFISFNGVLYTPALTQGCLPGVMRKQIIALAAEHRTEVQECALSPEVLFRADEVFLTNAVQGVQWVGSYKDKTYNKKISEVFVERLNSKVLSSAMGLLEKLP